MRKNVVVFGGTGFIGTYVVEELLNNGYEVIAADIQSSKYVDNKYFRKCDILKRRVLLHASYHLKSF